MFTILFPRADSWCTVGFVLLLAWGLSDARFMMPRTFPRNRDCDGSSYSPSEQSCCEGPKGRVVNDVPQNVAQCCPNGRAYRSGEAKPEDCTRPCGGVRFHDETELCCARRPVWVGKDRKKCCGSVVIDTNTHYCCGTTPVSMKSAGQTECCGHEDLKTSSPYDTATMTCKLAAGQPGDVTLKTKQRFHSSRVYNRTLPLWDAGRVLPQVVNDSHQHIRGMPVACEITTVSRGRRLLISLNPFFTAASIPADCAHQDTLHLLVKLGDGGLQWPHLGGYLKSVLLDVFFGNRIICRRGVATLRLKDGYNAVMYRSEHSGAVLELSLRR